MKHKECGLIMRMSGIVLKVGCRNTNDGLKDIGGRLENVQGMRAIGRYVPMLLTIFAV